MNMHLNSSGDKVLSRRAFSLVEILAVVAIIGVLCAIVIPSMSAARRHARMTKELSAAKQLMVAYLLAPQDDNGRLMQVSDLRAQTHALDVSSPRWTGRLRSYLGDRYRDTLYVNEQAQVYADLANSEYELTLYSTFGMNFQYVGGEATNPYAITRLNQAMSPSQLVAFSSGQSRVSGENYGYWKVTAPTSSPVWPVTEAKESYENATEGDRYGSVSFRYGGKAVVAFLDGHVALQDSASLRDMRLWSDTARRDGNRTYSPAVRQ